jgi:type II secretory pathway pseudopilin PulG
VASTLRSTAKSLFEKSLWLRRQLWRSAPVLGRSNIGKAAGVDFSGAPHRLTLLRPGTGALRWRTFQTGSKEDGPAALGTLRTHRESAFTMIEIALCLAIIGFALVAIIGVLPTGLNVQKENREETILNQDVVVWMNSIRNGAQGFNDLTNYVMGITNYWTKYGPATNIIEGPKQDGYDFRGSDVTSITPKPDCPITNGYRIIGLLSMPKYLPLNGGGFQSNYVVAYVRALSGSAVEKAPQDNQTVLDSAFSYKMIVENFPYVPSDSNLTNANPSYYQVLTNLQANSHDLRLTFRWPLLPNGNIGNSRATFRLFTGGQLLQKTDSGQPLYFIQSSTY